MNIHAQQKGFTIVELAVVIGIITILLTVSFVSLTNIQQKTYIASSVLTFTSDIKTQQLKAMIGDTEGRTSHQNYGIYFETNKYTLFHGSSYNSADSTNYTVTLENNTEFNAIQFPQSQLIFTTGTGEVQNFTSGQNTITMRNTVSNEQRTFTINKLGIITQVN